MSGWVWVCIGAWGSIGAYGLDYFAMCRIGSVYRHLGRGGGGGGGGGGVYGGLRMAMGIYACYGCLGIFGFL